MNVDSSCCAKTVSSKQCSLNSFVTIATHGHMSSNVGSSHTRSHFDSGA